MSTLAVSGRRYRAQPKAAGPLPWVFALATIGLQIAYPLLSPGRTRNGVTIATVVAFFLASLVHAAATRGARAATALVVLAGGGGFFAELVGLRTGRPFGHYTYAGTLGPRVFDVPVVVGLAWAMMAWPALLAGRRLTARRSWLTPLVAGWALAAWDVFLDPQMVDAGHWRWSDLGRTLPGIRDVPLTNFVGWLVVGVVMMLLLHLAVPRRPGVDTVPFALYLWTFVASVLANAVWFHRPAVALAGGVAMGVIALPLAWSLWRDG